MANDAFMKPEVPDSFRDLMKVSIEQTKRAFDTFAATSERTWKTLETSSQTASSGLRSLNEKIAQITRNNAEANFALAMKLAESKDVSQAMELQTEHARNQRRASSPACTTWILLSLCRIALLICPLALSTTNTEATGGMKLMRVSAWLRRRHGLARLFGLRRQHQRRGGHSTHTHDFLPLLQSLSFRRTGKT